MNYCYNCMRLVDGEKCSECGYKKDSRNTPLYHLKPGSVLRDRYIIGNSIGEGGFGITYIGRDKNLDMRVAVKEYYPQGYANRYNISTQEVTATVNNKHEYYQKGKERFLQEARLLAMFSGESSIVTVRDYFEANNTAYIVMEYLDGITLKEDLKLRGSFMFDELIELMTPLCIALGKIHKKGLIHRDISPDNIMFMPDGSLKLMDFGSVRGSNFDTKRSLSIILKPGYAPEEQYRSKGIQGPWTDIYAICATIYKCITCVTPDNSLERMHCDELKKPSELGVKIEEKHEAALMKGMSVYQNDRFKSIEEFLAALGIDVNKDTNIAVHRRRVVNSANKVKADEKTVEPENSDEFETALLIENDEQPSASIDNDDGLETALLIEDDTQIPDSLNEEPETALLTETEEPETELLVEDEEQSIEPVDEEDEIETAPLVEDELSSMDKQSEEENQAKALAEEKAVSAFKEKVRREAKEKSKRETEKKAKESQDHNNSNLLQLDKKNTSPIFSDCTVDTKETIDRLENESEAKFKKSKKKYPIIAVSVIIVSIIAVIIILSQCSTKDLNISVVGKHYDTAEDILENNSITYQIIKTYNNNYSNGTVINQYYYDGLDRFYYGKDNYNYDNSKGKLYLIVTKSYVKVPKLVGLNEKIAIKKLKDLGLKYKKYYEYDKYNNTKKGIVIEQVEDSDSKVEKAETIGITISKGPKSEGVPDDMTAYEEVKTSDWDDVNVIRLNNKIQIKMSEIKFYSSVHVEKAEVSNNESFKQCFKAKLLGQKNFKSKKAGDLKLQFDTAKSNFKNQPKDIHVKLLLKTAKGYKRNENHYLKIKWE